MSREQKRMNVVGATDNVSYEYEPYNSSHNDEVNYIGNQLLGSRPVFLRLIEN